MLTAALGTICLAAVITTTGTSAPGDNGRFVIPGARPSWTSHVAQVATVPAAAHVDAKVWLSPQNAAQLDALAQAVSDPSSSQYGQFLTTDQYDAQFAPSSAQVSAVEKWLTGAGLSIVTVGPSNHYIGVAGSANAINTAFGTQLSLFSVNGKQEQAPASDLTVPTSVSSYVDAVTGLTTFGHEVTPNDFGPPAGFVNATPCSQYYGQQQATNLPKFNGRTLPYAPCGYTPSQFRDTYGVDDNNGWFGSHFGHNHNTGSGVTVAITDAYDSPNLESDADTYSNRHGDQGFSRRQFSDKSVPEDASTGAECGGNGWYGEQALDVEAVHGMAQDANVAYYGAASCEDDDLLAALSQVVHDNRASIVTNSWGEPTFVVIDGTLYITIDQDLVDAYESVFKQGAVQGIGFYFSSGDEGDENANTGYTSPDWPTEDPWVTSVGGTSLAVNRSGDRQFETGWGTEKYGLSADGKSWVQTVPFLYGAGGGFSQVFDEPFYQRGVVPSGQGRAVPDIAADADPTTGMLVGQTQNFALPSVFGPAGVHYGEYRIGGTSLASPLMAGIQADAQSGSGHRIGFADPEIYALARQRNSPYYDVTPQGDAGNVRADWTNGYNSSGGITYSVRTFDQDSSLTTNRGWDDVTGVGTVTEDYFDEIGGRGFGH